MILHLTVKAVSKVDQLFYDNAGRLTAKIRAPAQDGKANAYLRKFLAKQLALSTLQITLVSGFTNPHKRFDIAADEPVVLTALERL